MSKVWLRFSLIALACLLSACVSAPSSSKVISISGDIELPLPLDSNKYWVDDGPLFVASKSPLVTYRVIDKEELNLLESDVTVHEFIVSSFLNPKGVFEKAFFNSHKEYEINHKKMNGLDFYLLSRKYEAKAYVVAKSIPSCVEISVIGHDAISILKYIVNETKLKKGE